LIFGDVLPMTQGKLGIGVRIGLLGIRIANNLGSKTNSLAVAWLLG
jgi:hypothetical protein